MTRQKRSDREDPPGPCEAFDCSMAATCKANRLACPGFLAFVVTGKPQVPWSSEVSRRIYDQVFPKTDPEDGGW